MASSGDIGLFSNLITLALFAKEFLMGFLQLLKELTFCLHVISQLNSIDRARAFDMTCQCNRQITELSQEIHRILQWCLIPYMLKHFFWYRDNGDHKRIETLLLQAQEVLNSKTDPEPCTSCDPLAHLCKSEVRMKKAQHGVHITVTMYPPDTNCTFNNHTIICDGEAQAASSEFSYTDNSPVESKGDVGIAF